MRAALLIALVFLSCTVAHAQTQQEEQVRIDRILKPDENRANPMQSKAFYGGKNFNQSRAANVKSFYYTEKVTPKTAPTRGFSGGKTFWGSNQTAGTKTAETHPWRWLSNLGHAFGSKKAETKQAWDAEKKYGTRAVPEVREYRGPEKNAVDRTMMNSDKKMSMNDVRELLNKNK